MTSESSVAKIRVRSRSGYSREQMAAALRIIAGREQCIDNLMSKADVANAALQAYEAAQ